MFYRIKQFLWAISCYFKTIDYHHIDEYLDDREKQLFKRLGKSDKQHSIRVSKDALNHLQMAPNGFEIDEEYLGKLALLHDIGKIEDPLNSVQKSLIVIAHKITKGNIKKYERFKVIDSYYNHPKKGVKLLEEFNYDKEFLEAIEKHHDSDIESDNKLLKILQMYDNKN